MGLALVRHGQYLQQNCSAYETLVGIADHQAAGRHSLITALIRCNGALVAATQLAPHATARRTMRYTHICRKDEAQALAGIPAPFVSAARDGLRCGCIPGDAWSQETICHLVRLAPEFLHQESGRRHHGVAQLAPAFLEGEVPLTEL
jgi:hypothetical protein